MSFSILHNYLQKFLSHTALVLDIFSSQIDFLFLPSYVTFPGWSIIKEDEDTS